MQETRVRSLDREDPLEKEMATHSSTLAWRIPWTEEPGRLRKESDMTERLHKGHFKRLQRFCKFANLFLTTVIRNATEDLLFSKLTNLGHFAPQSNATVTGIGEG